jgi:beta-mannosidase
MGLGKSTYVNGTVFHLHTVPISQGPELMTCGPYKPISVITYRTRIKNLHAKASILPGDNLSLAVDLELQGLYALQKGTTSAKVTLSSAGQVIKEELISVDSSKTVNSEEDEDGASLVLVTWSNLQDVGLEKWWPFGYGEQKLYSVRVEIFDPVNIFDVFLVS